MGVNDPGISGGVDTHGRTHQAAVVDALGRILGTAEFEVSADGYRRLLAWLRRHGELVQVGIEGTGTYGAGLCHCLLGEGVSVVEVDRPDRRMRRQRGKSDPIDAEVAARAALAGTATALPKQRGGVVESIRALGAARSGAVKARTAASNGLKAMIVTAPTELRAAFDGPGLSALTTACAALRPDRRDSLILPKPPKPLYAASPAGSVRSTRRSPSSTARLASWCAKLHRARWRSVRSASTTPVSSSPPPGRTPSVCAQKPHSLTCAVWPRFPLRPDAPRGTAYIAAATAMLTEPCILRSSCACGACPRTRAYVERRTAEGLSKPEIMRCLKRYLAREVYQSLCSDMRAIGELDKI